MKLCAFICNTPFQILGVLNLVMNNVEESKDNTDIFIIAGFDHAQEVGQKLSTTGIFRNVILCNIPPKDHRQGKWRILRRLLFPQYIADDYSLPEKMRAPCRYGKVFTGDGNLLGLALKHFNREAKMILYDDGLASYMGNCLMDSQSRMYKTICGRLNLGVYSYEVCRMYVNHPPFCESSITDEVCGMPVLNENNPVLKTARGVFGFVEDSPVKNYRYILLGQMLEEMPGYNGRALETLIVPDYRDYFLLRKHPRQAPVESSVVKCDTVNNMWELECISTINGNHVLIAFYSTAQITPKLIAGKEPYLIFAYKLFLSDKAANETHKYEAMIEKLRNKYTSRNKIYVPETFEEYRQILTDIR